MIQAGDVLHNPLSGETFVILKTGAQTGGEMFQMESRIEPRRGTSIPAHYHPSHTMRLSIKHGGMLFWQGSPDAERVCRPGDDIEVPIHVPYDWTITGDQELRFITTFEPAGDWDKLFESMCAIGRAAEKGELNAALASACVLNNFNDHMYLSDLPEWLQKLAFRIVAGVAGLLGYQGYYEY